jgi:hypothetical protein
MSRVLVAVKRVIDYNARVRVKPDKVHLGVAWRLRGEPPLSRQPALPACVRSC